MAVFAIGDIQGCVNPLEQLLERIEFDPQYDQLLLTGDLINRGPDSLSTIKFVRSLGSSVISVLGNHELHFLAVATKTRRLRRDDTLKSLLASPDLEDIVDWLRFLPLMYCDHTIKTLLVHAGIYPGWKRRQAMAFAAEVESVLRGDNCHKFLSKMYGNNPIKWSPCLSGWDRLRFITNVFTRMRFCDQKGNLNLIQKGAPGSQPKRYFPWYEHPELKCKTWRILFGHWAALGYKQQGRIISLDSGCVWGGKMTALRLDDQFYAPAWQLECEGGE